MKDTLIAVLFLSFLGSSFIGIVNRDDKELKTARIMFFFLLFLVFNAIVFLEI